MKPATASRWALLAAGLLAFLPAACRSTPGKTGQQDDEYEYVTVTGSNIPKKVRKGTRPDSSAPGGTYDSQGFQDMVDKGQHQPKLPAAGQ